MKIYITDILAERNISVNEFAKSIGVARSSLSFIAGYSPTVDKLQNYADALGIPTWELLIRSSVPDADRYVRTEETQTIVTRNIEKRLIAMGINKKEAARRIGVSAPAFTTALKRNISGAMIDKIAAALEVEPWQLFITQEEYDAEMERRSQPTPTAFDPHDPSTIQTVTEVIRTDKPLGEQVNADGSFEDLFAQIPEEPQEVVMQEGVTYVCGTTRITIVNGVMEIRGQDKKAI